MTLADLLHATGTPPLKIARGQIEASGLCADSRTISKSEVFVAMPSPSGDTHRFLGQAKERGAVAALVHSESGAEAADALGLAWALYSPEGSSLFRAAGRASHHLHGHPCGAMKMAAVTGTNGKTTTAWILRSALARLLGKAGYIGTIGIHDGDQNREGANTTPFPTELGALLADLRKHGCQGAALEASSHALDQERLAGCTFDVGVFTNLTQDHLDYHLTMEAYEAAKKRLFTDWKAWSEESGKSFTSVVNASHPVGARWASELAGPVLPVLTRDGLWVEALEAGATRLVLLAEFKGDRAEFSLPFGGLFQVENAACALGALLAFGWTLEEAAAALDGAQPVPGRFEAIPNDKGIDVVVDYAHTEDALDKLLESAQKVARGRIITVFGCGGDRDKTKRPKMAAAASLRSDLTVLTSDNPRTEDPEAILADVRIGLAPGRDSAEFVDRREAVRFAIASARPGDLVVLAGKGHEGYQIIGMEKFPMDDRELAREALT